MGALTKIGHRIALFLNITLFVLSMGVVPILLYAEDTAATALWVACEKDKCGYIDCSGNIVIPLRFDDAASFSEGLAPVQQRGRWGFVDTQGHIAVSHRFHAVEPFSGGLARVKLKRKWGYVDRSGHVIIAPRFNWAMNLREGMALVEEKGKYGYVDNRGRISVAPCFDDAGEFWEGLARVKVRGLWGFIDRTGKMIIDPQYDYADNFHEGLAQVEKNGKHGYITREGHLVIPYLFHGNRMNEFSEGLALVIDHEKYGYINKSGNMAIQPKYWLAWDFQEGTARVQTGDAKWILINRAGEALSTSGFDYIDGFHEGLARVRVYRDYGFVDSNGKLSIPLTFTAALPFSEGLAAVYIGGSHRQLPIEDPSRRFDPMSPLLLYSILSFSHEKVPRMGGGKGWGYIDAQGKIVIPPGFDLAGSFCNGLAEVQKGATHGYINKSGEFVWKTIETSQVK